jgi:sugar phosphate isomerase/epimerase
MKLGLLTACFPDWPLEAVARLAAGLGMSTLEIAAWPSENRSFTATHLPLDHGGPEAVKRAREMLDTIGVGASCIAYYENNLHPDTAVRAHIHEHLMRCIEAAPVLGCPLVGTFVGRDPSRSFRDNLREAEEVFRPLVQRAGELGIRLVIENCPMEGWNPDGGVGNLAYSPELWEWMFGLGLYLNYDPSHPVWLGIDPLFAIDRYSDRIVHVHAKDIETFPQARNRYGWLGKVVQRDDPWDVGWWRYRVPGRGEIDWFKLVDRLFERGYEGSLTIEHEDPVWMGSDDRIQAGIEIARATLFPLLVR